MNNQKSLLKIFIFISIIFVSCQQLENTDSNDIKVYNNKNEPTEPEFTIPVKKVLQIPENTEDIPDSSYSLRVSNSYTYYTDLYNYKVCVDKDNFIYVLTRNNEILKFDQTGQFIKSFSRNGEGPGEISGLINSMIINSDTILVISHSSPKFLKFDLDGKYIDAALLKSQYNRPKTFSYIEDDIIIGCFRDLNSKTIDMKSTIEVCSLSFKNRVVLYEYFTDLSTYHTDFIYTFTSYAYDPVEKKIYVYQKSTDKYEIKVFDSKGKYIEKITKNYSKVKLSDERISNSQRDESLREFRYHFSVYYMMVDKKGRLWVNRATDRTDINKCEIFDIFENGVFLNTIVVDFDLENDDRIDFIPANGDLYIVNYDQDTISKFELY